MCCSNSSRSRPWWLTRTRFTLPKSATPVRRAARDSTPGTRSFHIGVRSTDGSLRTKGVRNQSEQEQPSGPRSTASERGSSTLDRCLCRVSRLLNKKPAQSGIVEIYRLFKFGLPTASPFSCFTEVITNTQPFYISLPSSHLSHSQQMSGSHDDYEVWDRDSEDAYWKLHLGEDYKERQAKCCM